MDVLIEGWRNINHSYSLVNQWQINELLNSCNIFFKDVPFVEKDWNIKKNDSGIDDNLKNTINNLKIPGSNQNFDVTYRISSPYNFEKDFNSKVLFVFGTCEYKYLYKEFYKNGSPEILKYEENFFIHTPSNWSKDGFLKAGFREDQIIVIPHGV